MDSAAQAHSERAYNPITDGVIWKQLLVFFFPILLGTFFQQLYNTADAVIVGQFVGKQALAAVGGVTGTLINVIVNLFVGVASGTTVVVAQQYGAQNFAGVRRTVHTSLAMALVGGAGLMALGLVFARAALVAMGTPSDVLEHASVYLRVYFIGTIPSFIYNVGAGVLRAVGDTKRPLYFLAAACSLNIVLDLVFVVGMNMGVLGAALGTIMSQLLSAVLTMMALMRTTRVYRVILSEIRFSAHALRAVLAVGIPAGLQSNMYAISNIIIQTGINSFGTDTAAAWTAFGKIDGFFWMISGAYGIAITTFAGQNFGAVQRHDDGHLHRRQRAGVRLRRAAAGHFHKRRRRFGHRSYHDLSHVAVLLHVRAGGDPLRRHPRLRRRAAPHADHRQRHLPAARDLAAGAAAAAP